MIKTAQYLLGFAMWILFGGTMLASGEPPARVLLLMLGISLLVIGSNRIVFQSRARQSKPYDFSLNISDFASTTRAERIELAVWLLVGIGLIAIALSAFGSRA